jgi:hypothetical protein
MPEGQQARPTKIPMRALCSYEDFQFQKSERTKSFEDKIFIWM